MAVGKEGFVYLGFYGDSQVLDLASAGQYALAHVDHAGIWVAEQGFLATRELEMVSAHVGCSWIEKRAATCWL